MHGAFGQIDLFPLGRDGDGEVFGLLLQVDQAHFVKDVQADADAAHRSRTAPVRRRILRHRHAKSSCTRPLSWWEMR